MALFLRRWARCPWWLLLLLVFPGAEYVHAKIPGDGSSARLDTLGHPSVSPIAQVRKTVDGAHTPKRVGDTVSVVGRVSSEAGVHPAGRLIFVQDSTAGIAVIMPDEGTVERGQRLRVRGTVEHRYGLTQIDAFSSSVIDETREPPTPLPLTVSTAQGERYEGRLVRLRARVVRSGENDGGRYLLLADPTQTATARIAAFIPKDRVSRFSLGEFEPGTEIQVTGPLGQYDYSSPFDEYYQILPRSPGDLTNQGFLSAYYETAIILIIGGALLAVIVVITLRAAVKRRTEQLAQSRARFQRLAEATFEGIIIHENGQIRDVNRALIEMTGYDRAELEGRAFLDVLSESTRDLVRETVRPSPDEPYEAVMVRKDGSTFPAEIEEKVVDLPDQEVRVAAIRNVTERKKWETEILMAKQEAEEMAQLKSSLLNNMSHELRTPITSIIGYAELVMKEPDADHHEFAARIRQSGKRLSRTIRSVLEMAQIESGTLELDPREVDVRTVIGEVIDDHEAMIRDKGLSFSVDVADCDACVYTDRTLVYRALGNLLHNAVKFTDEGGVEIAIASIDSGLQIAISDTGIGIDPEFQPNLFEPFLQESDGPARSYEGTGLGLALTKRMVDLLGGSVEVESDKGHGSTFFVQLPSVIPSDKAEPLVAEPEVA